MVGRVASAVLFVVIGAIGPHLPGQADPGHTLHGFGPAQQATIAWALELFGAGGLELPDIDFTRHSNSDSCNGSGGWFSGRGRRPSIAICLDGGGPVLEFLVLHELAHAWDWASLSDERRGAFMADHRLDRWWGRDPVHWHSYAAEHAAEVIVWGLMDRPVRMARLPQAFERCDALLRGYLLLTARAPLHGYTDRCALA